MNSKQKVSPGDMAEIYPIHSQTIRHSQTVSQNSNMFLTSYLSLHFYVGCGVLFQVVHVAAQREDLAREVSVSAVD